MNKIPFGKGGADKNAAQRSAMSTMSRCSISGISWWCSKAPASWRGYSRRLKKQKSPVHFTTYWARKREKFMH